MRSSSVPEQDTIVLAAIGIMEVKSKELNPSEKSSLV